MPSASASRSFFDPDHPADPAPEPVGQKVRPPCGPCVGQENDVFLGDLLLAPLIWASSASSAISL